MAPKMRNVVARDAPTRSYNTIEPKTFSITLLVRSRTSLEAIEISTRASSFTELLSPPLEREKRNRDEKIDEWSFFFFFKLDGAVIQIPESSLVCTVHRFQIQRSN